MSKQTDRRAAEREARKLAYQQLRQTRAPQQVQVQAAAANAVEPPHSGHTTDKLLATAQAFLLNAESPAPATTETRHAINRANAQHSTGPITPAGKATAARNALKHGLTGNTVLVDSDDAEEYQSRLDYYTSLYRPETFEERRLVQAIHDANWRLDRVNNLESTIYAKGRIELENCFEEIPAPQRKSFIELETSQRYAKDLRNLHIQESRIQRQRTKDLAALKQLQFERAAAEAAALAALEAQRSAKPAPRPNGFVFATPGIVTPSPAFTPESHLSTDQQAA